MLQKDGVIKISLKRSDKGKKVDGIVCLCILPMNLCVCMCVFVFENNVHRCFWNPAWGFSFFSSHSLIELTDEVLRDPVRRENTDHHHETQPQGTELEQWVCTWERETDVNWKSLFWLKSPSTSSVCVVKISLCVCVFMAFCLQVSRHSVNQSTLTLYTSSLYGRPRLSVDRVYSCFPSVDSSHCKQAAQPCLLQTWAAFKGSKINHHRNVW